jgi:hypothetical protein
MPRSPRPRTSPPTERAPRTQLVLPAAADGCMARMMRNPNRASSRRGRRAAAFPGRETPGSARRESSVGLLVWHGATSAIAGPARGARPRFSTRTPTEQQLRRRRGVVRSATSIRHRAHAGRCGEPRVSAARGDDARPGSRYFAYHTGPRARSTRNTCPDGEPDPTTAIPKGTHWLGTYSGPRRRTTRGRAI